MKNKIEEWRSIQRARNPQRVVLLRILMFNVLFLVFAAFVISRLSLSGTEQMGFFEAAFYTVTMILDAGCISFVVADIGRSGIIIAVFCLIVIVIGMVTFTGAVIGYVTNSISGFIDNSKAGTGSLKISDHLVILNWNTRASEIVNDLLYCRTKQKVVILVSGKRDEIRREIHERLHDTIRRENDALRERCRDLGFLRRRIEYHHRRLVNNVIVLIREGDVFSSKQLHDISLEKARSVIILGDDRHRARGRYEKENYSEQNTEGNSRTIKTLMQVSDITSAEYSADDQKIIVEISDEWTDELVERIISYKQVAGKCNIVPLPANRILGQILAQFSVMPELNLAYTELFSNKGATFFEHAAADADETEYMTKYLRDHRFAIPLTRMIVDGKRHFFYSCETREDIDRVGAPAQPREFTVKLNRDYWIEKKTVVILGHNSKCRDIMRGFSAFRDEWNYRDGSDEILRIIMIDDQKSLENAGFYREYPFVERTVSASVFDNDLICGTIEKIVDENDEDTSVLILSDDDAPDEDTDANALAYLVYVQDIINRKKKQDPDFDPERIDVVVEIIDPKHHDIVSNYSVNNIVISNRYISKMITQIGEKEAIYSFYCDILTYDDSNADSYMSKEVYTKKVSLFFDEIPGECTAAELIRAVWSASVDSSVPPEKRNPTIVLGYVKPGGRITLFDGDQDSITVHLEKQDKIIVFTNH